MYSYIRQNKWHYKTCPALAAGTGFHAQTVKANCTKNALQVGACQTNDMHNYNANIETVQKHEFAINCNALSNTSLRRG